MRNFEKPTRSVAVSRHAMAATSHPSATLTALQIMEAGGNAMDAAIAACAVQCAVEPGSTGIGGDCFVLFAPNGSDQVVAYNGSGRTPAALTLDWFNERGLAQVPRQSAAAVTVPRRHRCLDTAPCGSRPASARRCSRAGDRVC